MKYIIDVDAFIECLDCLDGLVTSNNSNKTYVAVELVKEFIKRFPKDEVSVQPKILDTKKYVDAEALKEHVGSFTGMFTDEGFMIDMQAVLRAIDFMADDGEVEQ